MYFIFKKLNNRLKRYIRFSGIHTREFYHNLTKEKNFLELDDNKQISILNDLKLKGYSFSKVNKKTLDKIKDKFSKIKKFKPLEIKKNYLHQVFGNAIGKDEEKFFKLIESHLKLDLIAKAYLGQKTYLRYADFWISKKTKFKPKGSQLFHLDHEAFNQLKFFIYINNINEKNGCMSIVNKDISYQYQIKNNYKMDQQTKRVKSENVFSEIIKASGSNGTLLCIDTSQCFHKGGLVTSDDSRFLAMFQYLPKNSLN